jgi:hypothetical protein
VAVKNGTPRYGPLTSAADGQISFQTQPGEREVYLVVTGTPGTVHHYAFLDGYTKNYRYPYEFRIDGAVPSGYEPGYVKPPAPGGGRWHSNGGGWVDARANVAASAYVGPRAAVYGNSTVSGNARIEDLAWVNSGATVTGNAVVKNSALVQGGANLSGNVVIGGDAEPGIACGAGTYLLFNPDRGCDGRAGETDVNPPHATFTTDELAITGGTPTPSPTTPTASPSPSPSASTSPSVSSGASCAASYQITGQWQGGFQAEVTVRAGTAALNAWQVGWSFPDGQTVAQVWGGTVTTTSSVITVQNASWNGALSAGATTTFGLIATGAPAAPVPTCTAR